jgi:hypothetical protein
VELVELLLEHLVMVALVEQLLDMEILGYKALLPLELGLVENQILLEVMD